MDKSQMMSVPPTCTDVLFFDSKEGASGHVLMDQNEILYLFFLCFVQLSLLVLQPCFPY